MKEIRFVLSDSEEQRRDQIGKKFTNKQVYLAGIEMLEKKKSASAGVVSSSDTIDTHNKG